MFKLSSHRDESSSSFDTPQPPCRELTFSEIQLATQNFDESSVIGHGGFGKVYKGTITDGTSLLTVAIKRLESTSNQGAAEFWAEVRMLSKLRHCHLVSLIGYCNDGQELILVYEYMPHGTLEDHLHKLLTSLPWVRRLKICIGAARGLDYLHTGTGINHGVIHRDVKSSNILLDDSWEAKISDFGLSKICPKNQQSTHVNTVVKGTFGYLDPDYFYMGKLTRKSDVYAFGVVLFELLCGKRAVDNSLDEEQWGLAIWAQDSIKKGRLKQIIDFNISGELAPKCLKLFAELAKRCLHKHPKVRPAMAEVIVGLESVLALQEKINNTLDPRLSNPPRNIHGEQVAAGWPAWLSAVAGEAINGWTPRRADTFEKLDKIGQGTYSIVYKAKDTLTGKVVALKKVRFDNLEPDSVKFMAREILILRRLDHPNVVKLEGVVTSRMSCSLYLVFEYMEHDLAGLSASPTIKFTEPQIKCYMHQLLSGLEHCHNRHVLHRDIKGSDLLLDNSGMLKIADFGLATFFDPNRRQPMTSRVVTLWYRPPELLLGATDYGVGIDLWSAGCVLAELLAGKPIMPGRTEAEQLHKIFKLCGSPTDQYWKKSKLPLATIFKNADSYPRCIEETFKDFPPSSLPTIDTLLAIDPAERLSATAALGSPFFTTKPYACDPSSLPKYPSPHISVSEKES